MPNLPHTNEVQKSIYVFLYRLQENAVYCDTDSVMFIQPRAEPWPIATGDKLGDMQS